MKAAQLRQSILQAAVQGKLVLQNPQDEPASELLKRIQTEKSHLIKNGKIKKEKPLPSVSEEEKPYDLPDGWEWCRLGNVILQNIGGGTPSKSVSEYWNGDVPWASVKDLSGKYLSSTRDRITKKGLLNSTSNLIPSGNVIVCTRMGLGKISINTIKLAINQDLRALFVSKYINIHYFIYYYQGLSIVGSGMTVKGITIDELNNLFFPLPPLAEQQRIVAKVDELMTLCDELEAVEKELDSLEANLADYLPKSILQAAVRGKLVPQSIHDEPASELLKRIQEEKSCLIKAGKLKKEKPLPPISEEEIPYDLPDGWEWCRLGEIICLLSGRDLETKMFNDTGHGIPYITGASCINDGDILITRWTETPITISIFDDLIISCKGTIGKLAFNKIGDCHIARQLMAIRFFSKAVEKKFVKLFLASYVINLIIQAKSMIPGISREDVLFAPLPLPPLAEQQRIVAKIDELITLCEQLKNIDPDSALPLPDMQQLLPPLEIPPSSELEEQYAMAARGDVSTTETKEHRQAIEDLFGDGADG